MRSPVGPPFSRAYGISDSAHARDESPQLFSEFLPARRRFVSALKSNPGRVRGAESHYVRLEPLLVIADRT